MLFLEDVMGWVLIVDDMVEGLGLVFFVGMVLGVIVVVVKIL